MIRQGETLTNDEIAAWFARSAHNRVAAELRAMADALPNEWERLTDESLGDSQEGVQAWLRARADELDKADE